MMDDYGEVFGAFSAGVVLASSNWLVKVVLPVLQAF
jgi:hypothetical protein